ncbi:MFS transporter [Thiomonas sp.]|jgi:EmrB/QacA subfamily drug resistance transporter|uniref:MFS transporter n=1 Tax=Thiomonas sp. TaxID=2047785 RepID=UPI002636970E|nr:MFS transporter [Thiomonas sp.]
MTSIETISAQAAARRASPRISGRAARVLLSVSGVSFMLMLDSNVVAVSLPAIARSLGTSFADIEWVVSAYILSFAACLMPAGALADRFGRRRLMLTGLVVFTLASLLCGLAPDARILNAARTLQGIGGALQLSAALAVLGHVFRGPQRAHAFAVWGTVMGVAVALGPVVGGAVTAAFGWRWVFIVNVPVGIALLALSLSSVEESSDPDARRVDLPGMVLFGGALFLIVWAMIDANAAGWGSRSTLLRLAGGAALAAGFVIAERLQARPMVDLALFRRRTFLGSSVAMLGFAASAQVMLTYLPLYLQNAFGFGPAAAGLRMLPFALPLFIVPRAATTLAHRMSGRTLLGAGLWITAAGNALTAWLIARHAGYAAVAVGMAWTGCGAGLLNGETAKVAMSVIPPQRAGMASGIGATLRFVGLVVGITALGVVLVGRTRHYLAAALAGSSRPYAPIGTLVSHIVAGDPAGATAGLSQAAARGLQALARAGFAQGFVDVLLVAAAVAAVSAVLSWLLVSHEETLPVPHNPSGSNA